MKGVTIVSAEEVIVYVPLTPHQEKILPFTHRQYCVQHLVKVTLSSGIVGWGEGSQYSGLSTQQALDAVVGESPGAIMYDDTVGVPLQMALFDAVGHELGCPVHALLPGVKQRDWVPLSWWCHSNAPDEWVEEAKLALEHGYTTCKYKARPWWDIVEQVEAVSAVVPPDFKMDLDFNATLCNSASALPVLKALENYPNVAMIESPIPQDDIQGNMQLRAAQSKPIAMHFGTPGFLESIRSNLPDAFVVGGGASLMLQHSALAEEANIPFWLQLVGSGITTAWAGQFGAALAGARWPAITTMNILSHQLLRDPIEVIGGYHRISDAPGLGVEVDEEAIARFRISKDDPRANPAQATGGWKAMRPGITTTSFFSDAQVLYTIVYPDGSCVRYRDDCRDYFINGNGLAYCKGVKLETWEDDGSEEWQRLFEATEDGPQRDRYRPGPKL